MKREVINEADSGHNWEKTNLVTLSHQGRLYDRYVCKACGAKAIKYGIGVYLSLQKGKAVCPNPPEKNKLAIESIRITNCRAVGKVFANLTPQSVHKVIPAPHPEKDDHKGVWVMGVGEPVKVLKDEFVEHLNPTKP